MQMQRKRLNIESKRVVSLEEVAIFEERVVFGGFLHFLKVICKMEQNLIYQSIAADLGFLQVTLLLYLASPIGRNVHFLGVR